MDKNSLSVSIPAALSALPVVGNDLILHARQTLTELQASSCLGWDVGLQAESLKAEPERSKVSLKLLMKTAT